MAEGMSREGVRVETCHLKAVMKFVRSDSVAHARGPRLTNGLFMQGHLGTVGDGSAQQKRNVVEEADLPDFRPFPLHTQSPSRTARRSARAVGS